MVVAEDPTFGLPSIMPFFGWAIVHICASDVAVMGVPPEYMTICLLLPPEMEEQELRNMWREIHRECEKLHISIIGGHTGIYPGIAYPLNGGCTVFGFGEKHNLTPPSNAKVGDKIIMTKGAAIEAAAILAIQAEDKLKEEMDEELVESAKRRIRDMTVVRDALTAAPYAHAMHDATEGGLLNCLCEIAEASKKGFIIRREDIFIPEDVEAVCRYFNMDPLISISEGTLIITTDDEDSTLDDMKRNGIEACVIGEITGKGNYMVREGKKCPAEPVDVDPFWQAYFSVLEG